MDTTHMTDHEKAVAAAMNYEPSQLPKVHRTLEAIASDIRAVRASLDTRLRERAEQQRQYQALCRRVDELSAQEDKLRLELHDAVVRDTTPTPTPTEVTA
jgi:chromosome segregation ATPase